MEEASLEEAEKATLVGAKGLLGGGASGSVRQPPKAVAAAGTEFKPLRGNQTPSRGAPPCCHPASAVHLSTCSSLPRHCPQLSLVHSLPSRDLLQGHLLSKTSLPPP